MDDIEVAKRLSLLIGWLEGFSGSVWAMCTVQKQEVVTAESCAQYDLTVKLLKEMVLGE